MRRLRLFASVVVVCAVSVIRADFRAVELDKVPVERLVSNLEERVTKEPKNPVFHFNLARVHGMAYAQKTGAVEVRKGALEQGAWFGYVPEFVPFAKLLVKTDDEAKLKVAKAHLARAIEEFQATLKLQPEHLAAQLGLGWTLDQSGEKQSAIAAYRKAIEAGWAQDKKSQGALNGQYITREGATYLLRLLDADKDRAEIATLQERVRFLEKIPRFVTPIAIPLADGLRAADLVDRAAKVKFDADGTGKKYWSWITPKAGWLVMDRPGARGVGVGKIDSGLQLFGSVTFWLFWDHGYQPLAMLDDNGDGALTGAELTGLAIWHDVNSNGISEPGEVRPLADYGIVSLSCRAEAHTERSDCPFFSPLGVRFRDGTTRPTFDILLRARR